MPVSESIILLEESVDISKIKVKIDTKDMQKFTEMMLAVGKELETQLSLNVFIPSRFQHFIPTGECGMSGDEFRKRLFTDVLSVFDTACVNNSLKTLKTLTLQNV